MMLLSALVTTLFGSKLLRFFSLSHNKPQYRQILIVVYTLQISSVVALSLTVVSLFEGDVSLCSRMAASGWQNAFLLAFSLSLMCPCFLVPYVFYYVPHIDQQARRDDDILLDTPFIMEELQHDQDFSELINIQ